jgi:hypothetical protein
MAKSDWAKHWILEVAIMYQLYYMGSNKCTLDETINDVYKFCWVNGCTTSSFWTNAQLNFLYMTRSVLDAAIVWMEGVPENKFAEKEKWYALARQMGNTAAEIVK